MLLKMEVKNKMEEESCGAGGKSGGAVEIAG